MGKTEGWHHISYIKFVIVEMWSYRFVADISKKEVDSIALKSLLNVKHIDMVTFV